jgi:hypothetical protein
MLLFYILRKIYSQSKLHILLKLVISQNVMVQHWIALLSCTPPNLAAAAMLILFLVGS